MAPPSSEATSLPHELLALDGDLLFERIRRIASRAIFLVTCDFIPS